ncbi:MAG: SAM-dependent methyltransferase [Verrucomicrobia bacterium]|nr:SAM-dependent methyltransferase [Verrucomicrobiota bacterium]
MNSHSEVANGPRPPVSVMEGKGFYNKNAAIPAAGGALALPLLEQAARLIDLDTSDRPIVIADYGSSEGKNSLAPMRAAIAVLRARAGAQRPILVYHTDLPANDFSTLFDVLESDPNSYVREDRNVFAGAIGRSFYQSILPPNYVDLAWSCYAAVWLSQIPRQIPDHFFIPCSTGNVRAEFERQAALDWEAFLSRRASELRPGGRLVVVLPSLPDEGYTGFAAIMNHANTVLAELVAAGLITAQERGRMTIASCPRRERDLLAPFTEFGQFQGLVVERCSTSMGADTAWEQYQLDKDAEALARKRAQFFRAIFVPSLAQALEPSRAAEERQAFYAALETGLARRLADHPGPIENLVGMIVLAKQRFQR